MSDETDIWAAVEASNTAWTTGRPRHTAALLAEDVVMVAPGLADERGQETLVLRRAEAGWQAFWRSQVPLAAPGDGA